MLPTKTSAPLALGKHTGGFACLVWNVWDEKQLSGQKLNEER